MNLKTAVWTAKYAKYAKTEDREQPNRLILAVGGLLSVIRFGFAYSPYFLV
jgi:hypothetical protein